MAAIGGSIQEITIAGEIFAVPADADANVDLGGKTKELQMNGDGTARYVVTTKGWRIEGITVSVDHDRLQQESLQAHADDPNDESAIQITYANSVTLGGKGSVVDELKFSSQNATCTLTLAGPGKLEQQ